METAEPEAILSEEELTKLMGEGQSSEVSLLVREGSEVNVHSYKEALGMAGIEGLHT